jgi:hypothetical protein
MELQEVTANGFDEQDQLLFKFPLNSYGLVPPILIIPDRKIVPGKMLEIFNPLPNFPLDYPIHNLCYQFKFRTEKGDNIISEITVHPVIYEQKTSLTLPFSGTCLVTESHDFLTHHRRNFPLTHPLIQKIGITGNNSRFAYDFVLVDEEYKMFKDNPQRNEDFICWEKPVWCPGDGKIASATNNLPDNAFNVSPPFDVEAHLKDPETSMKKHLGNNVIIDHGNSEFSVLAHMREGSVQVDAGEKVSKGKLIGQIGTSGDSFFPHIHYQLQNGKDLLNSEGLPSKFDFFNLVMGHITRKIENSYPNTGMIIRRARG